LGRLGFRLVGSLRACLHFLRRASFDQVTRTGRVELGHQPRSRIALLESDLHGSPPERGPAEAGPHVGQSPPAAGTVSPYTNASGRYTASARRSSARIVTMLWMKSSSFSVAISTRACQRSNTCAPRRNAPARNLSDAMAWVATTGTPQRVAPMVPCGLPMM